MTRDDEGRLVTLGARAQIPTGYMVKTLRSQLICVRATLHPDAPVALELSIARTRVLDYL